MTRGGAAGPATGTAGLDVDELPDGVLVLDADRRVLAANLAASRLLRRPREALVGATLADLGARRDDGEAVWADGWGPAGRLRTVRAAPEQGLRLRAAGDREVALSATASFRRDSAGRVTGAVLALREAEPRERRRVAAAIEIVSTVSHELRSPLTSVKGYTSLMLNRWERLSDEQKRLMLGQVHHDADRVTRLIGELLDISRLESGRLVLARQLVDLPALAAAVVDRVRLEHPALTVTTEWAEGLPRVWADPDKIEQVLTNLLENACKYATPDGLVLAAGVAGDELWCSVADRGEGIPPEDLPKVFTKFFRRSAGRPTGSGLGLWISRGLVEAHGGRLSAASTPGEGSTFRFSLPLARPEEPTAP